MYTSSKFSITRSRDGSVPSKYIQPSTTTLFPIHIKLHVNNQPTEAFIDTGSAISIIHSNFLKTLQHNKFQYKTQRCQTANSTPLHIIGHIELKLQIQHINTSIVAHVATNLITPLLLGNDWINSHHVHLFGDQQHLTIPDQRGQLVSIPYIVPSCMNHPSLLVNQITLPPYSQILADITTTINHDNNLVFEPDGNYISKLIFIPHTLLNVQHNKAKILLINAQNRPQTLSKNTRIGTISRDVTFSIFTTTTSTTHQSPSNHKLTSSTVPFAKDNLNSITHDTYCYQCQEHFLFPFLKERVIGFIKTFKVCSFVCPFVCRFVCPNHLTEG